MDSISLAEESNTPQSQLGEEETSQMKTKTSRKFRLHPILKVMLGNPKSLCGLLILFSFVFLSVSAPLISPYPPNKRVSRPHQAPSAKHWFGTTRQGKDIFSQFLYGGRVSLGVGFGAGALATLLAVAFGVSSGYFGGKIDEFFVFIMNVVLVFPILPLILVLAAFLGKSGPLTLVLIIGLTSWAWNAKVLRAQTLSVRQKEFVTSAEVMGESSFRLIFFEIFPNLVPLVVSGFIGATVYAVITEAGLEFIGLGDSSMITWGTMLFWAQNSAALLSGKWWDVLVPCIAIAMIGGALSLINFSVDELTSPQLRVDRGMKMWKKMARAQAKEREKKKQAKQGGKS